MRQVDEVFERLHEDHLRLRIHGEALRQHQVDHEGQEEEQEGDRLLTQLAAATIVDVRVVDVVDEVEQCQHPRQEEYGQAQHQVPRVEGGLQAMQGIRPRRDNGHRHLGELLFVYDELCPGEEGSYGCAQQERA